MQIQSLAGRWDFRQANTAEWMAGHVPGDVHTELIALNRIPDPFVGDNELHVSWVADATWEYRRLFTTPPELQAQSHIMLVCDGLDTLATVTLNGVVLGTTDNMFRQYQWDVKPTLHPGSQENELVIVFASTTKYIAQKNAERALFTPNENTPGTPYIRKAPCQFGWDWGPRLPPIGIWKDIRLEGFTQARFQDVHVRQSHQNGKVTVEARITLDQPAQGALTGVLRLTAPDGRVQESRVGIAGSAPALAQILIETPQIWWPNGYGAQPLYHAEVALYSGENQLDHRTYQLGLRTIELRQEDDKWGRSFQFVVNGVPIFAKGSNWIPADSFPTRLTTEHMEMLISAAAEAHQNMLRVWGGGFYEDERFYDLCDKYGILVWQDFIYACAIYPLDNPAFLENVHVESVQNIRRLRHRASLALWCGNNEMEWGWKDWNWDRPDLQDLRAAYDLFFHHTLGKWCNAEDPDRSYWPSSPSSNLGFEDPNGQLRGDAHYWDVWHGRKPFTAYRAQFPRFMSEFGFQSLPPLPTIRTYADEADWNITSYIMERHQKNNNGNALIVSQMLDTFRLPKDFPALVYLTMVLQAEGIRYGVEHWRRAMDRVAGTLYWQLNDCWPVASWSSLDYFGRWKALHYMARRFYAPVLLSIEDRPPTERLFLSNDTMSAWEGTVRWSLETVRGTVLEAGQIPAKVGPLSSALVHTFDFAARVSLANQRELVFVADLLQGERLITRQVATFVPTKHMELAEPVITATVHSDHQTITVELVAQTLARFVELALDGADVVFSDNYFDLPAGRTVTVTCPVPAGWTDAQIGSALRLKSVYDSFAPRLIPDRCVLALASV